ncbi:16S rRNA (adenine(1518)-N(6)/adenine(1519)-N(6))-dimethyltransferase RsmA [Christensenellaceae bacterium 44-20]
MEELYSPKVISELLKKYQLAPLKKLGQNFLRDENIVSKIAEAAVRPGENALEIGPGLGVLTQALARRAKKVVAVEIDKGMVQVLSQTLEGLGNTQVLWQDFLKADLQEIAREHFGGEPFAVVGNLPYYITSKCLLAVLEAQAPVLRFTAMVQKEVAERLMAGPGDANYGAITASVAYYGRVQQLFTVSRNCFLPAPDVDSAVIGIEPKAQFGVPREDYTKIVRGLFAQRRKTLQNNMKNSLQMKNDEIQLALEKAEIPANSRAENLSPQDFAKLAEIICKNK